MDFGPVKPPHSVDFHGRRKADYRMTDLSLDAEAIRERMTGGATRPPPLISALRGEPAPLPSSRTSPSRQPRLSADSAIFRSTRRTNFFIIDPQWMSESITIKKLGLEPKPAPLPLTRRLRSDPKPDYKRSRSAPSWPKSQNPITWE